MRRFASLIGKEFRQHALPLLGVALLLLPIEALMLLGTAISPRSLSYFEIQRSALLIFLPVLGLVLGNRLVVSEYYGRTQLFLEALPIRRWEPLTVKYLFGLLTMALATLGLLVATGLFAFVDEPFDAVFLVILAGRSLGFVVAGWSFLFLMGFTGRFRLALYVALIFSLAAIGELTDFEVNRFGPLRLVDETFPFERASFPVLALFESLGLSFLFVAAAFGLAMVGDGSLAESLAKRMSAREKGAVGAALLVGLLAYTTLLEDRRQPDPYAFPEGTPMVESAGGRIQITFDSDEDQDLAREVATALLGEIEGDVAELPAHLGWATAPIARIALRSSLDGDTFEAVSLADGDGVLLRANYRAPDADRAGLRATLLRELITAHTRGRAVFEPQRWFLDGYARYLTGETDPEAARMTALRALYASREAPVTEETLEAWNLTRERWGAPVAEGLAGAAVAALADDVGEEKVHRLARALYAEEAGTSSWVSVRYALHPFPAVFEEETGRSLGEFIASLGGALDEQRRAPWALPVAAIPRLSADLQVEVVEGQLRAVAAQISQEQPRRETVIATLLHHRLEPLDELLVELELERDDVTWEPGARAADLRLEGRYGPGERAFFAVEVESAVLECPIRVAAERRTVQ